MRPQPITDQAKATRYNRMLAGAVNYAASDRSDPFAMARALTHIGNGVAGINHHGHDAFYDADEAQEQRLTPEGVPYFVTVYRNVRRP